eukprot:766421-Hanusia_phi.AAC.15
MLASGSSDIPLSMGCAQSLTLPSRILRTTVREDEEGGEGGRRGREEREGGEGGRRGREEREGGEGGRRVWSRSGVEQRQNERENVTRRENRRFR